MADYSYFEKYIRYSLVGTFLDVIQEQVCFIAPFIKHITFPVNTASVDCYCCILLGIWGGQ